MRYREIISEDGLIVPGVNSTIDVKPGETKRQAAKMGFTVDENGVPPTWTGFGHSTGAKDTVNKADAGQTFYGRHGTPPNRSAPLVEGYNIDFPHAFWYEVGTGEIVECDDHHAQEVFLNPSSYGLDRDTCPELQRWVKFAEENGYHKDDPEVLEEVAEDRRIWNMMLQRGWVRANYDFRTAYLSIMAKDIMAARKMIAAVQKEANVTSVFLDAGDLLGHASGVRSFHLKSAEQIDLFVKHGQIPSRLREGVWDEASPRYDSKPAYMVAKEDEPEDGEFPVWVNPSRNTFQKIVGRFRQARALIYRNGKVVVWDELNLFHSDVYDCLVGELGTDLATLTCGPDYVAVKGDTVDPVPFTDPEWLPILEKAFRRYYPDGVQFEEFNWG